MRLVQFTTKQGERRVAIASDDAKGALRVLSSTESVYQLAQAAIANEVSVAELAERRASNDVVDYDTIVTVGRLLPPLDHPTDPAHCLVTGTGLTHLGSADARDQMHQKMAESDEAELTDSKKMFKLGLDQGKPAEGGVGAQPEWFYKGDGDSVVRPGHGFELPGYALDGSEEAEIVGLYLIGDDGSPYRVGFALGNEYSDHVLEQQNYLYLAHSKLRQCAYGPELMLGALPEDVRGNSRLLRDGKVLWQKEFLSGEANMTHTLASLEHHHFKYRQFRRPGDVHVHFFGAANLSYADEIKTRPGDVFEISADGFGLPLRNSIEEQSEMVELAVRPL